VGCPDKASAGKKLCTTCFMKACEEGEIKLSDGSTFTSQRPGRASSNGMTKGQISVLKKAFAAITADEDQDRSEDDDDCQGAPVGVGGPACSAKNKRKRADAARQVDDANKRVKEFAESLGIEFN
jgi:hypothetical protein